MGKGGTYEVVGYVWEVEEDGDGIYHYERGDAGGDGGGVEEVGCNDGTVSAFTEFEYVSKLSGSMARKKRTNVKPERSGRSHDVQERSAAVCKTHPCPACRW